jgi:hypothetical protein
MDIKLKKSKSKWVDIDEKSQFLIEYPTIEQSEELKEIAMTIALIDDSLLLQETPDKRTLTLEKLTAEDKAKMLKLSERLYKRTIRYCVKDWKGVPNEEGENVKCRVINNELDYELYEQLVRDLDLNELAHIYNCIQNETELTENDKKK